MLTRAMAKQLSAASAHKCLFIDFLSEEEPQKVSEALKHPGWVDAMQDKLNQFARNKANPKESYLIAVKRIFRYLKGTPSLELWYPKCLGFDLKGYLESDYAGCNMERKSTSGACATSSCANILWMKSQLTDYDIIYEKVSIFCDNTRDIELHLIPTQYQLADIFTKPQDENTFKRLIVELASFSAIALTFCSINVCAIRIALFRVAGSDEVTSPLMFSDNPPLTTYEATRAANALDAESQSQNGSDGDNEKGGDRNGGDGNGNGGNGNPNENNRGARPIARECTYQDFMKCQPLNFKGMEGVVGLIRWFEKMETVFHISNCLEKYQVKYANFTLLNSALTWWNSHKRTVGTDAAFSMSWRELMKLMAEVYSPINEIQNIESELWNLTVKNNDLAAYTQRFQELTMLCTKMVHDEEDKVERFIGGLPDNIQGNVIVAEPTRLQDAVRTANNLMDQKLKGYATKTSKNKRRLEVIQRHNRRQQPPFKDIILEVKMWREPMRLVAMRKGAMLGLCLTTTNRAMTVNQRVPTCFECGRQGHYKNECPKLKNQNRGNKAGKKTVTPRQWWKLRNVT
uniref:CCHC-type domain-containing protein n=1 Tax=Tanacetum cinerariifolium TaxID=118510 RepID=A0A6L2LA16_TANCI|nr:hypothetical protein [Tanacetum cinerariifolium]